MSDQQLMQSIKTTWGIALDTAAKFCTVQASFLAALIANESGGDANAKRFEPGVLSALWQVLLGRKATYGSIGGQYLVSYITHVPVPAEQRINAANLPNDAFNRFDGLATSWGLVQIMGYEAIAFGTSVSALQTPSTELPIACRMLADFARRNGLDVNKDFSELFDCWNTGRPHAPTADPQYIPNGLARMKIYEALA